MCRYGISMIGKLKTINWWIPAIIFFGIGDLVTTIYGLEYGGLYEQNPTVLFLIEKYGYISIGFVKILCITALYGNHIFFTRYFKLETNFVPMFTTMVGVCVTMWNLNLILTV